MVISSTEKKQCKVKWAKFGVFICLLRILLGFPGGASGNEPSCQCRRLETNWIPGLGRSLGGGDGNPLQNTCLENPMKDRAWQATVHRVAKSWKWMKWLYMHAHEDLIKSIWWKNSRRVWLWGYLGEECSRQRKWKIQRSWCRSWLEGQES